MSIQNKLQQLLNILAKGPVSQEVLQQIQGLIQQADQIANNEQSSKDQEVYVKDLKDQYDKARGLLDEHKKSLKGVVEVEEQKLRFLNDEMSTIKKFIFNQAKEGDLFGADVLAAQMRVKELSKLIKIQEDSIMGFEKGKQAAKTMLQATFGLQTEWSKLGYAGAKGAAKGFVKGIFKSTNIIGLIVAMAEKAVGMMFAADTASAELFKTTGIGKDQVQFTKFIDETNLMISDRMPKLVKAYQALSTGYKNMGELLGDAEKPIRDNVVTTIMTLSALGADQQDTVASFSFLTKTLNKTPEQATTIMHNFKGIADSLGRPTREIVRDFAKNSPILARFGDDSEKIFKDAAFQATLLEMETAKVLSLGDSFDTFEGAAKAAQSFNTALGGPFLSAHTLLTASVPEKIKVIQKAYQEAGNKPLSQRMIRALATDLNMRADEVQRALKIDTGKFMAKKDKLDSAQSKMEDNIEMVNANQSITDKLSAMMEKLVAKLVQLVGGESGLAYVSDLLTRIAEIFMSKEDKEFLARKRMERQIVEQGGLVKSFDSFGKQVVLTQKENERLTKKMQIYGEFEKALAEGKIQKFRSTDMFGDRTVKDSERAAFEREKQRLLRIGQGVLDEKEVTAMLLRDKKTREETLGYNPDFLIDYVSDSQKYMEQQIDLEALKTKNVIFKKNERTFQEQFGYMSTLAGQLGITRATNSEKRLFSAQEGRNYRGLQTFAISEAIGEVTKADDQGAVKKTELREQADMSTLPIINVKPVGSTPVKKMEDAVVSPMNVPKNYVQPVFNKKDTFVAAKDGGVIANALDDLVSSLEKLLDQKTDLNLNISERELAQSVDMAFNTLKARQL